MKHDAFSLRHNPKYKHQQQHLTQPIWKTQNPVPAPAPAPPPPSPSTPTPSSSNESAPRIASMSPLGASQLTNGYWESSLTGSRKLKNPNPRETSVSGINTAVIAGAFSFGLTLVLLGFWSGWNARGIENLGQQVEYTLPIVVEELVESPTRFSF